jgi:tetratricopeptide (TPR) repeat protein
MEMIRNLQRTDSAPLPLAAPPARHPRLSRALVFALAAVLAVLAAAVLWQMNRKPQPVNAGISSSAVAVLPFTVRGGDTLGLGEGMVGLLGTKLDGAGDLHSVDSRAVLSYAAREASRTLGPDQGRAIAEHFGAGMFVLGDVLTVGGRLRLTASLYDARAGSRAAASASVEGSSDRVFELVDSLAAQLLKGWSGQEYRLTGIASMTTQSLPALKAFLDGESAFRAGNFDAAVEGFQRAVAQDPQFALAWYRMSIAAEWLTRTDIARDAAEHAMQLADRLSEHDRLLLKALVATRRGAAAEAARLYQNVLATYPNDVEAWLQLGEVQFHYGPLAGHSITEAQATWRRVAALEPRFFAPIVHLTRIAASQGNRTEVDSLVRRALELRVGSEAQEAGSSRSEILELETLRAFALGDTTEQSRLMSRLESATDVTVYLSMWGLGSFLHDPAAATRVGTALTSSSRPPWPRVAGYIAQSNLAAARGHIEAANAMLDSAAILDPRAAAEARATLATYAFRHADRAELEAARNAVERAPDMPEPPAEASVFLSVHHGLHRHLRAYLLGVLDARLGNGARAARYAAELENLQAPLDAGTISRDLAQGVRGEIAAQRERPAEVTEAFAGVRRESWYELASASPYFAQPRERFIQAEALVAQGRDAEATVLYRSLSGEGSSFELPYLAPAQLRLGEIADRQGRADEAAQHYAKVIELWRDADPALQPMVKEARARLAKARGEK